VLGAVVAEAANPPLLKPTDANQAGIVLRQLVHNTAAVKARGGLRINTCSPDESLEKFLKRSGFDKGPLVARAVHALTDSKDRTKVVPDKVVSSGNVVQTLKFADLVALVDSMIPGRVGHPDFAFLKAYQDPGCASGHRWHVVLANEARDFITQYSSADTVNGRVLAGEICFVGNKI